MGGRRPDTNQQLAFATDEELLDEIASRGDGFVCGLLKREREAGAGQEIHVYFTAHQARFEDLLWVSAHLTSEIYADWVDASGSDLQKD